MRHRRLSYLKSGIRILGFLILVVAELVGIAEEAK
jgi:hypothetical protein